MTSLLEVIDNCNIMNLQKLLKRKACNVNEADKNGLTPMHLAVKCGSPEMITMLLSHGATCTKDRHGLYLFVIKEKNYNKQYIIFLLFIIISFTTSIYPLHYLVQGYQASRNTDFIKVFARHDIDLNCVDYGGQTPLHVAAQQGLRDVVECLLDNGADIDVQDENGFTPLHDAADEGYYNSNSHTDTVKLLLDRGANSMITDQQNWSPINWAKDRNYTPIVELLSNTIIAESVI